MNNINNALSFEATLNNSLFNASIADLNRQLKGVSDTAVSQADRMDSAFSKLARVAAGYFAFTQLSELPGRILEVRGAFQQLEIALETMLGSKSKADKLFGEVVQLAATTPFGLKDAAQATKQLLAYGSASSEVIGELKMLGDVASGVSAPIGELTYLYGTLKTQGRAYATDIRQFAGRGIPIYAELAKVLKINKDEVASFVEQGRVGFPEVEKAFRNMTGSGGMFFNLMEKQSKSLTGLTSQLNDALDIMFNNIGEGSQDLAAGVIQTSIAVVENYQKVGEVLTVLVATYGAYRAAVATVNAVKTAEATTSAAIAASIDRQSGGYAREIALKVKTAQATAQRTAALAQEAAAQYANAQATLTSLRAEVSALAAKKASSIESAKAAASEITAAEARLAAAEINQAAVSRNLDASVRSKAAKELESAQNALLIASENGVIARKAASAASSDFITKKTALETAAKTASTAATTRNATATVAGVAASNASAIASTRLTAAQSLQIAVTRQLALAQAAFNASMLSNPIVLGTAAVVALAGAMWYLTDATTAQEVAQKRLNAQAEEDKRAKDELVGKTSELTGIINSNTSTTFAQVKAYNDLQKLYPGYLANLSLQEFKLLKTEDAQKRLNAAIDQMGINTTTTQYD